MQVPLERHLLDLYQRDLIEQAAFAHEYEQETKCAEDAPFPRTPHEVIAATIKCFEYAEDAINAVVYGYAPSTLEYLLLELRWFPSRIAHSSWVDVLRAVEDAQSSFLQRLRTSGDVLHHTLDAANADHPSSILASHQRDWFWRLNYRLGYRSMESVAAHVAFWMAVQPALLRSMYVWERGETELAIRMFARATQRVEPRDELRGIVQEMHYTLAQMYRFDRQFRNAIHELRVVLQIFNLGRTPGSPPG